MAMPYSGDVDSALVSKVLGDAQLAALMPDGVYWDVSASGKTRVVIVSLLSPSVTYAFDAGAFEEKLYLVKAVELNTSAANVKAAAARIDALLNGGTLALTTYDLMNMELREPIHYAEPDPANKDARWQHYGGVYAVYVSPK